MLTPVSLVDGRGPRSPAVLLDLSALRSQAEVMAAGEDPVPYFCRAVLTHVESELGVTLSRRDADAAGGQLTRAMFAAAWPQALDLLVAAPVTGVVASAASAQRDDPSPSSHSLHDPPRVPEPTAAFSLPFHGRSSVAPPNSRPMTRAAGRLPAPPTPRVPMPEGLFDWSRTFPLDSARDVYDGLVGLDGLKVRLLNEAVVLTQPAEVAAWAKRHHGTASLRAAQAIAASPPLLVFAGDVGTGKSALAESFGDAVARQLKAPVHLLRLSVQTRGSGIVGDMTRRITEAFQHVQRVAEATQQVTVLLLDEADALAESRETSQMHHEDRAGVNALIQGIDQLRASPLPILVVFCSNRVEQIDPAIQRRAVDIIHFTRPDATQRREHLGKLLGDLSFSASQWEELVQLTGARAGRPYGCTYSDLSDRLVRQAVLTAFPSKPLTFALIRDIAQHLVPTRPFAAADGITA